ncbi:MAG: deoxyribodipyrimidine photo-lyase [Actinomycetota bacterium]|nr:deoxyribodipyrimidine photo-lyase [Actinomycetota bacterium]
MTRDPARAGRTTSGRTTSTRCPAVMVFTRDLRVRDNPALCSAQQTADGVLPLFVLDPETLGTTASPGEPGDPAVRPPANPPCPNRVAFLAASLQDLDTSLRELGSHLVLQHGDWVHEVLRAVRNSGATAIHLADDVSLHARHRFERLQREAESCRVAVVRHPGVTVVPPGAIAPAGKTAFAVFTPYHRAWERQRRRPILPIPDHLGPPPGQTSDTPRAHQFLDEWSPDAQQHSPDLPPGGERAGLERLHTWVDEHLAEYERSRDDLAAEATSRISPYLHLGCLSPLEAADLTRDLPGGSAFTRQLCWRDFFHQVLAARPDTARTDHTDRQIPWTPDEDGYRAWATGRTGHPLVDAGLRQLRREGYMHNRARMVVASFLTKDLLIDWRRGAAHFRSLLVDGDVACNQLNWQWVAGTGTGNALHRVLNPTRQAQRFDPHGTYIRRHVPELANLPGPAAHDPDPIERRRRGYPEPIVDHALAAQAFLSRVKR